MAKAVFGEYAAFDTQGGIRFMKNSKLASEKAIPVEVIAYLKKNLGQPVENIVPPVQRFAPPTEEQKKAMREESLKVKPELAIVTSPDQPEEPLTPEDFDVEEPAPVSIEESLAEKLGNMPVVDPDFMESVSIHTASLQDIALALYERFGIYTVYLGTLPNQDEINPLTGEGFTRYHLGIAYQAAIRAQNTGLLNKSPENNRRLLDEGRYASDHLPLDAPVSTMGQARRDNSYEYRTSVQGTETIPTTEIIHVLGTDGELHAEQREIPVGETGEFNGATAHYNKDEDEVILEPNFGARPIIRPNW